MNLSQARAAADMIETVNAKRRPMTTYDDWKCAAPGEHPLAKEAERAEHDLEEFFRNEFKLGKSDTALIEITDVDIVDDRVTCGLHLTLSGVPATVGDVYAALWMLTCAIKGRFGELKVKEASRGT